MFKKLFILVLVLGMAGNALADLRGYWPLDGGVAPDSSLYGNDGTLSSNVGPTTDRFGNPNSAMYFTDGLGNINVGDDASLNLTGAMTITAWAYLDTTSSVYNRRNSRILGKMDGGGQRAWSAGIEHKDGEVVEDPANFQISSTGSDVISCLDDATIPLDEWFHYAGVYNPGTSMELYINGDLAMNVTTGVPASQYSANGWDVLIGNRPAATDCGWYGALDEVRIYSDPKTETEIEAIMAIPEPATMLMLGLGGLALMRRRKR